MFSSGVSLQPLKAFLVTILQFSLLILILTAPIFSLLEFLNGRVRGFGPGLFSFSESILISAGLGVGFGALVFLNYVHITKYRRSDPNRFRRTHTRQLATNHFQKEGLTSALKELGYLDISIVEKAAGFEVLAKSPQRPSHPMDRIDKRLLRYRGQMTPQVLVINVSEDVIRANISIKMFPAKSIVYCDFTETTYFLMEELIDRMRWRNRKPHDEHSL